MALHRGRRGFSVHPPTPPTPSAADTQSQLSPTQVGGNVNNSSSSGGRKRGRGPTRGLDLLMMARDKRIVVEFNKQGQAIGEYASNFANLCGVTVRNPSLAPLQVEKWDDIPDHAKEMMWKNIQEYVDVGDEKSKWIMQSLAKKFRDYRKRLKNGHYLKWETDEDRLGHPPPNVSMDDWTWLVQYWSSPKAQAVAERNKINRSHQTLKHTGGTKSFARYIDEESRARTDGSVPTRADIFIRTHTRKDGKAVDDRSEEIISKFRELLRTPEDGSCSSIGDDIYTQVMGPERHGRVRGYGLGPTPSSVFGSTSSQSNAQYEEMHTQLHDMRQQMERLKTKHSDEMLVQREEIQRQQEEMQRQQEEMQRQREEMQRKQDEMQRKQDEMMELVQRMMSGQR